MWPIKIYEVASHDLFMYIVGAQVLAPECHTHTPFHMLTVCLLTATRGLEDPQQWPSMNHERLPTDRVLGSTTQDAAQALDIHAGTSLLWTKAHNEFLPKTNLGSVMKNCAL